MLDMDDTESLPKNKLYYLLVLIPIVLLSLGQLLSKQGALTIEKTGQLVNVYLVAGYCLLLLRGFIWILILKKVSISLAYPMMSLTYVIILVFSYLIFNETITTYNIIGTALIITGIITLSLGGTSSNIKSE